MERDDRSAAEKFLTILAYRPKQKAHCPQMMKRVRRLKGHREAGNAIPDPFYRHDDLITLERKLADAEGKG